MSSTMIHVSGLGKKYQIATSKVRYRTARDTIVRNIQSPFRRAGRVLKGEATGAADLDQDFWALNEISFEIEQGEVVGIIGRNGAGKSTLLKILSRVTEPSTGYADLFGRVGALLEVGTGFHNELTGRENVLFNGAILGMSRQEIIRRFEQIVDFAEIAKFIDTPVKYYSSGMRLRLAFSIAAHLEPEILIVDEVLAVGDANFRKKCLERMEGVSREGRTVLFVSHNMPAVTRLCQRAILLDNGRIIDDGPVHKVAHGYLNADYGAMAQRSWSVNAPGDDVIRLRATRIGTEEDAVSSIINVGQDIHLEIDYEICRTGFEFLFYVELFNEDGTSIFTSLDTDVTWLNRPRPAGDYTSRLVIPGDLLQEGTIHVHVAARTVNPMVRRFRVNDALTFQVIIDGEDPDIARRQLERPPRGIVRPLLKWTTYEKGPK